MDQKKSDGSSAVNRVKRSGFPATSKLKIRMCILFAVAAGLALIVFLAVEPSIRKHRGQRQSSLAESMGATGYILDDNNYLEMVKFFYFPKWFGARFDRGQAVPPTHVDMSRFSRFSRLESASFVNCDLDSISELTKLKHLEHLELYDCSIDKISSEDSLAIRSLYYEGSDSLRDFPQLPNVKSIEIGRIIDNPGSRQDLNRTPDEIWPGKNSEIFPLPPDVCLDFDVSELGRFTTVEHIAIYNKNLEDFRGCERLQQLKSIHLLSCRAKSLDGLANLKALTTIYFDEHFVLGDSSERRKMTSKEADEIIKTLQQCKSLKELGSSGAWNSNYDVDKRRELLPGVKML